MLLHVYGVTAVDAPLPADLVGRSGVPVRQVADDRLAVLVTEVDDDARVKRADLLAHAHLLEAVAAATTVVPMRFGVLMPDEDTVRRELLEHRRDHLLGLLAAFDGLVQVTVQASYEEDRALRELLQHDRDLAALREAALGSDDPDLQVRLGQAVASGLAGLREQAEQYVVARLQPHVEAAVVDEPHGAYDVANVALLVRRDTRARIDAAVADLDREVGDRMRLRYVGPQPPYAFLDRVELEERSWA